MINNSANPTPQLSWTWQRYIVEGIGPFILGGMAIQFIDTYLEATYQTSHSVHYLIHALGIIGALLVTLILMKTNKESFAITSNDVVGTGPLVVTAIILNRALQHPTLNSSTSFSLLVIVLANASILAAIVEKALLMPVAVVALSCMLHFLPVEFTTKSAMTAAIVTACIVSITWQAKHLISHQKVSESKILVCGYSCSIIILCTIGASSIMKGYKEIASQNLHTDFVCCALFVLHAIATALFHDAVLVLMHKIQFHSVLICTLALSVVTVSSYKSYSFVGILVVFVAYATYAFFATTNSASELEKSKSNKQLKASSFVPIILLALIVSGFAVYHLNDNFGGTTVAPEASHEEATFEQKVLDEVTKKLTNELQNVQQTVNNANSKLLRLQEQHTALSADQNKYRADIAAIKKQLIDKQQVKLLSDKIEQLTAKIKQLELRSKDSTLVPKVQNKPPKTTTKPTPPVKKKEFYVSFVLASRNDQDPTENFQRCINVLGYLVKKHKLRAELIVVEWNPPDATDLLAEAYDFDIGMPVSVITVAEDIHDLYDNQLQTPMLQYAAKNVGIRRSKGKFVALINQDILVNEALIEYLAEEQLSTKDLYRVHTTEIYSELKSTNAAEILAQLPKVDHYVHGVKMMHKNPNEEWWSEEKQQLPELPDNVVKILINRAGDFVLVERAALQQVSAYEEQSSLYNQDITLICALLNSKDNRKQHILFPPIEVFHLYHGKVKEPPRTAYLSYCRSLLGGDPYSSANDEWGLEGVDLPTKLFGY